jgi:hypothetical protein
MQEKEQERLDQLKEKMGTWKDYQRRGINILNLI